MKITETQLLNIITEELVLIEQIVRKPKNETSPMEDEALNVLLSFNTEESLNEALLSEDIKDRIRSAVQKLGGGAEAVANVAKRLALPVALVASIAAGAGAGSYLAGDSTSPDADIELSTQADTESGISQIAGTGYGEEYYGMSEQEKIDKAWQQFDLDRIERAPVSSDVPMFKYAIVSYDQIDGDTVLPMIGTTASDYYDYWKQKVESDPKTELPLLKKMVFGNVGKWLTGEGNEFFKKTGDYNILPPDWSVAHAVYADLVENQLLDLDDYLRDADPETKARIYKNLDINSDQEYSEYFNNQMFKIGR
tara:strand:- start:786 stop:1712 length:927 start_codon:yes stop_codon:yes gene_type:complete